MASDQPQRAPIVRRSSRALLAIPPGNCYNKVMIELPDEFVDRMNQMLGGEAPRFWESYRQERTYGLRLNRLKMQPEDRRFEMLAKRFRLAPVPWCGDGYYYDGPTRPGKHPYHSAGLYYIQEPSAMLPVEQLDPRPGETVLDLSAAPGGKSTQIAAKLQGQGLLVANEIHPLRAKVLSAHIERFGIANAVVTNESPERLAERFPAFFDKIIVDAPCSGEGMFRKDPEAIGEWSPRQVDLCAARQRDILEYAAAMVKPGGQLAYSTCTFSMQENEYNIDAFLQRHPAYKLVRADRIWPHREPGEGHFAALLQNAANGEASSRGVPPGRGASAGGASAGNRRSLARPLAEAMRQFESFRGESLPGFPLPAGEPLLYGEQLYLLPSALQPDRIRGLKVLRPGLHLARVRAKRIEPAHALAMAVRPGREDRSVDVEADSDQARRFLQGQVLQAAAADRTGWVVVTADSYPLGWGKLADGVVKNHLPKGLRLPG